MDNETPNVSRRMLLSGVATGFLATAIAPAEAQTTSNVSSPTKAAMPTPNPVNEYPQPPFPKQQQPWPGLAGRMNPRPDHGEKSYKGSGRLAGRKALVTGGDSGIGRAAAIAYAREGADVYVLLASPESSYATGQVYAAVGGRGGP